MKNNTIIYVERASNSKRDCEHDLYCCLLLRISDCNTTLLESTMLYANLKMKIVCCSERLGNTVIDHES